MKRFATTSTSAHEFPRRRFLYSLITSRRFPTKMKRINVVAPAKRSGPAQAPPSHRLGVMNVHGKQLIQALQSNRIATHAVRPCGACS
jgi:hypothetical protein